MGAFKCSACWRRRVGEAARVERREGTRPAGPLRRGEGGSDVCDAHAAQRHGGTSLRNSVEAHAGA